METLRTTFFFCVLTLGLASCGIGVGNPDSEDDLAGIGVGDPGTIDGDVALGEDTQDVTPSDPLLSDAPLTPKGNDDTASQETSGSASNATRDSQEPGSNPPLISSPTSSAIAPDGAFPPAPDQVHVGTTSYDQTVQTVLDTPPTDLSLPSGEDIKVEDFVQAFDPGYEAPETLPVDLRVDGAYSPFRADRFLLRVGLSARHGDGSIALVEQVIMVVELAPEAVSTSRLLGYEYLTTSAEETSTAEVTLGLASTLYSSTVFTGQSSAVLFELALPKDRVDPLGSVRIYYHDTTSDGAAFLTQDVQLDRIDRNFTSASRGFRITALAAEYALVLKEGTNVQARLDQLVELAQVLIDDTSSVDEQRFLDALRKSAAAAATTTEVVTPPAITSIQY